MARLTREMTFPTLESWTATQRCWSRAAAACCVRDDLSEHWARILVQRLAMYRGLEDETVRKFGAEHFHKWDQMYSFFVGLYQEGKLGGGRFVARRSV